jgi:heme/copper-type cytochrome/quinol oxidase subunit 2
MHTRPMTAPISAPLTGAGQAASRGRRRLGWLLAVASVVCLAPLGAATAAEPEFLLVIKNHRFEPNTLKVPAGARVKLVVHNQDATPEEFESHSLNREKIVPAGSKVTIYIGPLKAGRYDFFGEYNPATATGVVVAE